MPPPLLKFLATPLTLSNVKSTDLYFSNAILGYYFTKQYSVLFNF